MADLPIGTDDGAQQVEIVQASTQNRLIVNADGALEADLDSVGGTDIVLGQTTMSASIPVVIASNQSPIVITQIDGYKTTYSAAITGLTVALTPTDIFTITGSATKTVRVTRLIFSGTENTATVRDILIIKRSIANSGGTSSAPTIVPYDSTNAGATATVLAYTANPSLGAAVGTLVSLKFDVGATNLTSAADRLLLEFGATIAQAVVLRGTSQVLAVNLNSVTSSSSSFDITVEWTEE